MSRWEGPDDYWVSDDPTLVDVDFVHDWLSSESYWAQDRAREVTEKALSRSLNLSLFAGEGTSAGFCRWVTDGATFAWLCDVFVDPAHRGHGLGIFLVETAVSHPEVNQVRRMLGTRDAHELYRKFGFTDLSTPSRLMEILVTPLS